MNHILYHSDIGIALVLCAGAISFGFLCVASVKRASSAHAQKATAKRHIWLDFVLPAAVTCSVLASAHALWAQQQIVNPVIKPVFYVALAWLAGSIFGLLAKSKKLSRLATGVLVFLQLLNITGILPQLALILQALTFTLGPMKTNLYTIGKTLLVVLVLLWLVRMLLRPFEAYLQQQRHICGNNRNLIVQICRVSLYCFVALFALHSLGINFTALTVFGGTLGVGIGFGLQKITSNFISGVILLFENSLQENDLLELNDGTLGFVRRQKARYTLIETLDNKEILIPNEDFITHQVTNWTHSDTSARIEISVGVSYDSDLEKVQELMLESAREHPWVVSDPEPACYLHEFGDSSVNFLVFFWVKDVKLGRHKPQSDVLMAIWKRFKEHDIEIPYPQRDLHLKSDQAGLLLPKHAQHE